MNRTSLSYLVALSLCSTLAFTACKDKGAQQSDAGHAKRVLATYNGGELTEDDLYNEMLKLMQNGPDSQKIQYDTLDARVKQALVKDAIAQRLVVAEAKKAKVEDDAEVEKKIKALTNRVVSQEYVLRKAKELVTEEKIRAFYDKDVQDVRQKEEFRASHILVKSEEEAKATIEQLKQDSSKFPELAREKSIDSTRVRGGNLGYFLPEHMVPEFANAVKGMKVGEISGPVKTDFGWHVIYLQDRRQAVPPAYDKAKPAIERKLRQEAIQKYVEDLTNGAAIVYVDNSAAQPAAEEKAATSGEGKSAETHAPANAQPTVKQ
ncbi:MAG: peptidylprolyl isomerase [Alphaproteobacteria bacterium]|nr:peptidylprolyl isomerase [Alphaproteobacteria bacterium]